MMPKPTHNRSIEIQVSGENWAMDETYATKLVREVVDAAQALCGAFRAGALEVWFAQDKDVRALNKQFRGQDKATNVLSFAPANAPILPGFAQFGQLVLADNVCAKEALARAVPMADHTRHLVLHGLLHLQGYNHEIDDDAQKMEALERKIMSKLGLHDPYLIGADAICPHPASDDAHG